MQTAPGRFMWQVILLNDWRVERWLLLFTDGRGLLLISASDSCIYIATHRGYLLPDGS
jgi:hypothetical protein